MDNASRADRVRQDAWSYLAAGQFEKAAWACDLLQRLSPQDVEAPRLRALAVELAEVEEALAPGKKGRAPDIAARLERIAASFPDLPAAVNAGWFKAWREKAAERAASLAAEAPPPPAPEAEADLKTASEVKTAAAEQHERAGPALLAIRPSGQAITDRVYDFFGGRNEAFIILAVLFAGLILRVFHINVPSLWEDEVDTMYAASRGVVYAIQHAASNYHPPLYFGLMAVWTAVFGTGEAALRLPSVLFGLGAIVATYRLVRHLFDRNSALAAAFLAAISGYFIQYSQEARPYSLVLLLSVLSGYFLVKAIETGSKKPCIYLLATNICILYTDVPAAALIGVEILFSLIFWKRHAGNRRLMLVHAATVAAAVPLAGLLWSSAGRLAGMGRTWLPMPSSDIVRASAADLAGGAYLFWLFIACLAAGAAVYAVRRRRRHSGTGPESQSKGGLAEAGDRPPLGPGEKIAFLAMWLLLPFTAMLVFSLASGLSLYQTRYLTGSAAALVILVAAAAGSFRDRRALIGILVLAVGLTVWNLPQVYRPSKSQDFRLAAQTIEWNMAGDDGIVIAVGNWDEAFNYYFEEKHEIYNLTLVRSGSVESAGEAWKEFEAGAGPEGKAVWVVIRNEEAARDGLLSYLQGRYGGRVIVAATPSNILLLYLDLRSSDAAETWSAPWLAGSPRPVAGGMELSNYGGAGNQTLPLMLPEASGDFVVTVDYQAIDLAVPYAPSIMNSLYLSATVGDVTTTASRLQYRAWGGYGFGDWVIYPDRALATSDAGGKLRLRRAGASVFADYWRGGQWVNLGWNAVPDGAPASIRLGVFSGAGEPVAVRFTNISIEKPAAPAAPYPEGLKKGPGPF